MRERMTVQEALDTFSDAFSNVTLIFDGHATRLDILEQRIAQLEAANAPQQPSNPIPQSDPGAAARACAPDPRVVDLALDLAYIDPRITSSGQARVRVGAEFLLRTDEGETKEEAVEALRKTFNAISEYSSYAGNRSLRAGIRLLTS